MSSLRGRGRPRNPATQQRILDATRALIAESGYDGVSMDRVAVAARVGVQTVYRRWPSKAPLVADAVLDAMRLVGYVDLPSTGDVYADLKEWLNAAAQFFAISENVSLIRALVAAAAQSADTSDDLFRALSGPLHQAVQHRLDVAVRDGHLRAEVSTAAIADTLCGSLLYHALIPSARRETSLRDVLDVISVGALVEQSDDPPSPPAL